LLLVLVVVVVVVVVLLLLLRTQCTSVSWEGPTDCNAYWQERGGWYADDLLRKQVNKSSSI